MNWLPVAVLVAFAVGVVAIIAMNQGGLHARALSPVVPSLAVLMVVNSIGRRRILGLSWRESIAGAHAVIALVIIALNFGLTFLA